MSNKEPKQSKFVQLDMIWMEDNNSLIDTSGIVEAIYDKSSGSYQKKPGTWEKITFLIKNEQDRKMLVDCWNTHLFPAINKLKAGDKVNLSKFVVAKKKQEDNLSVRIKSIHESGISPSENQGFSQTTNPTTKSPESSSIKEDLSKLIDFSQQLTVLLKNLYSRL